MNEKKSISFRLIRLSAWVHFYFSLPLSLSLLLLQIDENEHLLLPSYSILAIFFTFEY